MSARRELRDVGPRRAAAPVASNRYQLTQPHSRWKYGGLLQNALLRCHVRHVRKSVRADWGSWPASGRTIARLPPWIPPESARGSPPACGGTVLPAASGIPGIPNLFLRPRPFRPALPSQKNAASRRCPRWVIRRGILGAPFRLMRTMTAAASAAQAPAISMVSLKCRSAQLSRAARPARWSRG
jgi:hypothetical protein